MDLLGLLEGSSSSSSSSSEENSEDGAHKEDDQADDNNNVAEKEKKNEHPNKKPKLGSVDIVLSSEAPNIFVRSVPHRRGHWSGHVLVPITCFAETSIRKSVVKFQRRLEKQGYSGTVIQHAHFHLSLSMYFSLQLTFVDSFVQQLTKRLNQERSTRLYINKRAGVLVNDEKTRSFWGWKIQPNNILKRMVQHVDDVLKNYSQPPYYDPPIFHVSLASFAGNLEDFEHTYNEEPASSEEESEDDDETDCCIQVDQVHCKFGTTKNYIIDLQPP
jgi:2'-5' RNA ligase